MTNTKWIILLAITLCVSMGAVTVKAMQPVEQAHVTDTQRAANKADDAAYKASRNDPQATKLINSVTRGYYGQ